MRPRWITRHGYIPNHRDVLATMSTYNKPKVPAIVLHHVWEQRQHLRPRWVIRQTYVPAARATDNNTKTPATHLQHL